MLRLVHVRTCDPPLRSAARFYRETTAEAAAVLEEALLAAWACGGPRATTALVDARHGDVATAITWQASAWHADLIVPARLTCKNVRTRAEASIFASSGRSVRPLAPRSNSNYVSLTAADQPAGYPAHSSRALVAAVKADIMISPWMDPAVAAGPPRTWCCGSTRHLPTGCAW